MRNHNFERLEVYQRSLQLAKDVVRQFAGTRPYRLSEQICSSVFSIPSNISEGAERGTNKEFRRFLEYASGSAAELFTQLQIVLSMEEESKSTIQEFIEEVQAIRYMIRGLMNSLES